MAFWGKSWRRSEREDSKTRYFQCGMNARQRLCGYCPHPRAPGALALSLDRERDLEKQERKTAAANSHARLARKGGRKVLDIPRMRGVVVGLQNNVLTEAGRGFERRCHGKPKIEVRWDSFAHEPSDNRFRRPYGRIRAGILRLHGPRGRLPDRGSFQEGMGPLQQRGVDSELAQLVQPIGGRSARSACDALAMVGAADEEYARPCDV